MEHIKIEQNSNVEVVDSNIIHKLAEEAQDCDASSNMTGNLQTTNAYEDDVDFLMAKFPGLNINVTNGMYIRFEDPAVLSALITNNVSSDGQGVTTIDALAVTNLNSLGLTNNSSITSFTELRQFKNITYAPGGFFSGCTNLEWIALPENNTNLGIGFQISGGKTLKWVVPNMEFACSRDFNAWYQHPGRGGGSDHVWTFYDLDKQPINDVVIPDGITTIGKYLFSKISCNSITFPSGIEEIKNNAFENAQFTQSFALDFSSLTTIGSAAFIGCSALIGDLVLSNLTNLGSDSLRETSITSVDFTGSSITKIPHVCFYHCSNLTSVTVPSTTTAIEYSAFEGCTSLSNINLNNISYIESNAFKNTALTSVDLTGASTLVGESIFQGCSQLTTVTLSSALTTLPKTTFYACSSLTSINLNNVTTFKNQALQNCTNLQLTQSSLSPNIVEIGDGALQQLTNTTGSFSFSNLTTIGRAAFSQSGFYSIDFTGSTFTSCPQSVFKQCSNLHDVTFPDTCNNFDSTVFYYNLNLQKVVIPYSGQVTIASDTFSAFQQNGASVYVDDDYVDVYRANSLWTSQVPANNIKPISSL